jgi:hypothetical protein
MYLIPEFDIFLTKSFQTLVFYNKKGREFNPHGPMLYFNSV